MPRPKRSKVAPSAPAQLPESLMKAIRADKEGKKSEEKGDRANTRRTSTRTNKKTSKEECFMSGALGVVELQEAEPAVIRTNQEFQDISLGSSSNGDEPGTVPSSMRSEEAELPKLSSILAAPATIQRPKTQRSTMPGANWRTQATPRMDSSAIGNFKRRPRQPSILGIGRRDDSSVLSSLGGEGSDHFLDELENFEPTIATPLIRSKVSARPATGLEPRSSPPSDLNTRKRKRGSDQSLEVQVRKAPSFIVDEPSSFLGSSPEPFSNYDGIVALPAHKKNTVTATRTSKTSSPQIWSDTMAPPQSSPSDVASEDKPAPRPQKRKERPKNGIAPSKGKSLPQTRSQKSHALQPISTAQLQNLLPPRRTKTKSNMDDSLSLPLDFDDENEASFQPTKRGRKLSKQPKTPVKKSAPSKAKSKSKAKATLQDKTNAKAKAVPGSALRKSHAKASSAVKPGSTARIYTRKGRVASGQENEEPYVLPPTGRQPGDPPNLDPKGKNELAAIARKFVEVDEWEMEFEEVDGNSSGSGSGLLVG